MGADSDETNKLLEEFQESLSAGLSSKERSEFNDGISGLLDVDIGDCFQFEACRFLRQVGGIDCEVFMIPSYEKNDIDKLIGERGSESFDFRITTKGKVLNFKILIQKNSSCSTLLCKDFANLIIKSVNRHQNYKESRPVEIKEESVNFTYSVELKDGKKEIIILNIQEV